MADSEFRLYRGGESSSGRYPCSLAVALGGAACLWQDVMTLCDLLGIPMQDLPNVATIVACNDAGYAWQYRLDAWVTLHARYFFTKHWIEKRVNAGFSAAAMHIGHINALETEPGLVERGIRPADYKFFPKARGGTSGLFAAKFAMIDLGAAHVIVCGMPLVDQAHFFDPPDTTWISAEGYRGDWVNMPDEFKARLSSMSGWTRVLLDGPPQHILDGVKDEFRLR